MIEREAIRLIGEWQDDGFAPDAINRGNCDLFADELRQRLDCLGIACEERDQDGHVWLEAERQHYDAEAPAGVACYAELPYFRRLHTASASG